MTASGTPLRRFAPPPPQGGREGEVDTTIGEMSALRSIPLPQRGEGLGVGGSRVRGLSDQSRDVSTFAGDFVYASLGFTPPPTPPRQGEGRSGAVSLRWGLGTFAISSHFTCSPSKGEGRGGGDRDKQALIFAALPPPTPPRQGEGRSHRERVMGRGRR